MSVTLYLPFHVCQFSFLHAGMAVTHSARPQRQVSSQPPVHHNLVPDASYSQLALFSGCSVRRRQLRQSHMPAMPHTCHASPRSTQTCIQEYHARPLRSITGSPLTNEPPTTPPDQQTEPTASARAQAPITDGTKEIFSGAPHSAPPREKFLFLALEMVLWLWARVSFLFDGGHRHETTVAAVFLWWYVVLPNAPRLA